MSIKSSLQVVDLASANSQRQTRTLKSIPSSCAMMNGGTALGAMPENVLVIARAMVTAGLAKDVEAVNQ